MIECTHDDLVGWGGGQHEGEWCRTCGAMRGLDFEWSWDYPDTVQLAIDFLDGLLMIDPEAVRALIETRVPCNAGLADHPTVQVTGYGGDTPKVGLLGILNGLFGCDEKGWGFITAVFEEDGSLSGFRRTRHATD